MKFKNYLKHCGILIVSTLFFYSTAFSQTVSTIDNVNEAEIIWSSIDQKASDYLVKHYKMDAKDVKYFKYYTWSKASNILNDFFNYAKTNNPTIADVNQYVQDLENLYNQEYLSFTINKNGFIAQLSLNGIGNRTSGSGCTNTGFEDGTTTGWVGYNGLYTLSHTIPGLTYSQVLSGSGVDKYGSFPVVFPGAAYSLRLDSSEAHSISEEISQTVSVSSSNSSFTYSFAVVLQDGGHDSTSQPFFRIEFYDQNGNEIPCTHYLVAASSHIPGFQASPVTSPGGTVYYKPWTTIAVDLTNYINQNVTIKFIASGCSPGGHFGYAYIHASCAPYGIGAYPSAVICNNSSILLTAPAGAASYLWSGPLSSGVNGLTTPTVTTNVPGQYSVQMTSVSGTSCTFDASVTLTTGTSLPINITSSSSSVCPGGGVTLTASGANSYTWTPAVTPQNASGSVVIAHPSSPSTNYTVVGSNSTGCTGTASTVISVAVSPLVISVTPSNPSVCMGNSVTLTATGADNYTWTPAVMPNNTSESSVVVSPTATTTYTVVGTNLAGCSGSTQVVVTTLQSPLVTVTPSVSTICAGDSITLTAQGSAGTGTYHYLWFNGSTNSTITFSPTANSAYGVTVTDGSSCVGRGSGRIFIASPINNNSISLGYCYATDPKTLTGSIPNGGSCTTYTYQWQSKQVSPPSNPWTDVPGATNKDYTAPNSAVGTLCYRRVVMCGSCSNISNEICPLPASNSPVVTIKAVPNPFCLGGGTVLNASGADFYTWTPGVTSVAPGQSQVDAAPTITTTYTAVGTNSAGCTSSTNIVVRVQNPPTVHATSSATATICPGDPVNLSATGAASYLWAAQPQGGSSSNVSSSPSFTDNPMVTTTYTVVGSDSIGCTGQAMVVVTVFPVITNTIALGPWCNVTDPRPIIGSTPTGGVGSYTFQWQVFFAGSWQDIPSRPPLFITTNKDYTVPGGAAPRCYRRKVTSGTCVSYSNQVCPPATSNNPIITVAVSPSYTVCPGTTITLTASGANTYTWSPAVTNLNTSGSQVTTNPNVTTTYTVVGTNSLGCSASVKVVVHVYNPPVITAQATPTAICYGDPVNLMASGGVSYVWYAIPASSPSYQASTQQNFTDHPTENTIYLVVGTDNKGCTAADITPIVNVTPAIVNNTIIYGSYCSPNGPIPLSGSIPTGGSGSYSYQWQILSLTRVGTWNDIPNSVFNNSISQNYTAPNGRARRCYRRKVTSGSCTSYSNQICFPAPSNIPVITARVFPDSICPGATTFLTASGANTYTWTPTGVFTSVSGNQMTVAPHATTTYTVVGTNSAGCTASASVVVHVRTPPAITASASPADLCPAIPTTTLTATGAAGNTYSWTDGVTTTNAQTFTASPTQTTTYFVVATDVNGCSNVSLVVVNYASTCPCGPCANVLPATFNSSTTYNALKFCINNNVVINTGATLNLINSEFKIRATTVIRVKRGATLNITGSHLYACGDMWQGIVVEDGGRVNIKASAPTIVIHPLPQPATIIPGNSSLIEDAVKAVDIENYISTTTPLTIDSSILNKNEYGVYIRKYRQTTDSIYPLSIQNSIFTCRDIHFSANPNTFNWPTEAQVSATHAVPDQLYTPYINNATYSATNSNAFLKAPFSGTKPFAGVYAQAVGTTNGATYYQVQIGQPGTARAANFNIFDNLKYGIVAVGSNISCVNNVIQNTINPPPSGGDGGIGIYATNPSAAPCRLKVMQDASGSYINKFYDCPYSIYSSNYLDNEITNCDVRCSKPISIFGVYTVVSDNSITNITQNKFYNIINGSGVVTFSSNGGTAVNITQNTYQPQPPAGPAHAGAFINNAIYALRANDNNGTININSNTINNVYSGIVCSSDVSTANTNWNVNLNTISLVNDATHVGSPQFGIQCTNNFSTNAGPARFADNTISYSGSGAANANMTGIYVSMCNNVRVARNIMTGTANGAVFAGSNLNTRYACNTMNSNSTYGFVLDQNGVIGDQPGGFNPQSAENRWAGNWTGKFKTATLNGSSAQQSRMYVPNPGTPSNKNPNGFGFTSGQSTKDEYFYNPSNPPVPPTKNTLLMATGAITCSTANQRVAGGSGGSANADGAGGWSKVDITLLEKIALDQIPFPVNTAETQFIYKHQLYSLLQGDTGLMDSSAILKTFKQQCQPHCIGQLTNIAKAVATGNYAQAQSLNNSLDLQHPTEANYQTYYRLYMKYKTDTLNTGDSAALVSLAMGCPFTDGAVVYQARSLYNVVYKTVNLFTDNCVATANNQRTENQNSGLNAESVVFDAVVYPNPNKDGWVQIAPTGATVTSLEVVVSDIAGKLVYKGIVPVEEGRAGIQLNVNNGVYNLRITNTDTHETTNKKVVISK